MTVAGILLAAGEGRRMGMPKALLHDEADVPYLDRAVGALLEGGCDRALVVLGAGSEQADAILVRHGWRECDDLDVVVNERWAEGMSTSLDAGLAALEPSTDVDAAVITLVDLADMDERLVGRFVARATPGALARATYGGHPGHPVLIGREHWAAVRESLAGDAGARGYLDAHGAAGVVCDDLATGRDLDDPEDLSRRVDR